MAEITGGLKGLNPYAPEFFPIQKLLSVPSLSFSSCVGTPVIPYYGPPQLNPNQYFSFYFSSYLHEACTTTTTTQTSNTNYSHNPIFPTQNAIQIPHNFVQPSTEPTLYLPQGSQVLPHEEQQKTHGRRVHNQNAMTVPQPPKPKAKGYNSHNDSNNRWSFGNGSLGSSIGESKRNKYEKRREGKPKGLGSGNNYKGFNSSDLFVPKKVMSTKRSLDVLPVAPHGDNTTVMIRNIPNKYNRDLLVAFLDAHCALVNRKSNGAGGEGDESAVVSGYDFLYLPIDFETGFNKGYAFVNFTNPRAVWKFYLAAHRQTWGSFHSNKICEIAYAKIQGKEELVSHFEMMRFPCESEDVLPLCFDPPRDGYTSCVVCSTVGKIFRKSAGIHACSVSKLNV